jgi:hypothetical protein
VEESLWSTPGQPPIAAHGRRALQDGRGRRVGIRRAKVSNFRCLRPFRSCLSRLLLANTYLELRPIISFWAYVSSADGWQGRCLVPPAADAILPACRSAPARHTSPSAPPDASGVRIWVEVGDPGAGMFPSGAESVGSSSPCSPGGDLKGVCSRYAVIPSLG